MGLRGSPGAAVRLHLQRRGARPVPHPAAADRVRRTDPAARFQPQPTNPSAAGGRRAALGQRVQPAADHDPDRRARRPPDRAARPCWTGRSPRSRRRASASATDCRGPSSGWSRPPARARPSPLLDAGRRPGLPAARRTGPGRSSTTACACRCCGCSPSMRIGRDPVAADRLPGAAAPRSTSSTSASFTVAPIRHVPVSPVGTAPVAGRPTDLARPGRAGPGGRRPASTSPTRASPASGSGSRSPGCWPRPAGRPWSGPSPRSTASTGIRVLDYRPPVAGTHAGRGAGGRTSSPASGPVLRAGEYAPAAQRWSRTRRLQPRPRTSASAPRSACGRPGLRDAGDGRRAW